MRMVVKQAPVVPDPVEPEEVVYSSELIVVADGYVTHADGSVTL